MSMTDLVGYPLSSKFFKHINMYISQVNENDCISTFSGKFEGFNASLSLLELFKCAILNSVETLNFISMYAQGIYKLS